MQNLLLILFSPSSFLHNTFSASFLCIFMGINLQAATGMGSFGMVGLDRFSERLRWALGKLVEAVATLGRDPRCVILSALTDSQRTTVREGGKSVAGINSTAKPPAGSGQFQVEKLNIHTRRLSWHSEKYKLKWRLCCGNSEQIAFNQCNA